jgi:hypothetical protein
VDSARSGGAFFPQPAESPQSTSAITAAARNKETGLFTIPPNPDEKEPI